MAAGHLAFIPKGFRFQPTNEEVFDHFLPRKNLGQRDFGDYVPDIDDTKLDPWELRDKYKGKLSHQRNEKEWWFFSPRTREGTTKRTTGSGWWKSGKGKEIMDGGKNQPLGTMKTSTFCRGSRSSYKTDNWILHEYYLPNLLLQDKEAYFVLCHLNEKDDKAKNKTGGEDGHSGLSGIDQQEVQHTNGEISSQTRPRKRPIESTDAPSGPVNEGLDFTKLDEEIDGFLQDVAAANNSLEMSPFESLMLLGYCFLRSSPELLEEVGPAEGKTASVENRNAKSQPSSPVSPSIVARLKSFKASKSSAPAESFPKASVVKEELTAANPLRNKNSIEKVEAGEKLVQETKEQSGPKSKFENQDPLTLPPSKYLTDVVVAMISRLVFQEKEKRKEVEGTRECRIDRESCKSTGRG